MKEIEKSRSSPYRFKEQNTIRVLGIPIFQWKNEVYENPNSDKKESKENESNSK